MEIDFISQGNEISVCSAAILRRWLVANRHSWDADWFAGCVPITSMWRAGKKKIQYFYSARSCKYEVPRSEICISGLYHRFSLPLILLTNGYAGCGRPTLNFVERFWFGFGFGSVRSTSWTQELISELQMNSHYYKIWNELNLNVGARRFLDVIPVY